MKQADFRDVPDELWERIKPLLPSSNKKEEAAADSFHSEVFLSESATKAAAIRIIEELTGALFGLLTSTLHRLAVRDRDPDLGDPCRWTGCFGAFMRDRPSWCSRLFFRGFFRYDDSM